MKGLILFSVIIFVVFMLLNLLFSKKEKRKLSILYISLNKFIEIQYPSLTNIFKLNFKSHTNLIVIPDEFEFMDDNFYWLEGYCYIHYTDLLTFVSKNLKQPSKADCTNDMPFTTKLNNFLDENAIFMYKASA